MARASIGDEAQPRIQRHMAKDSLLSLIVFLFWRAVSCDVMMAAIQQKQRWRYLKQHPMRHCRHK
jgi:hypothetical protein